ncbi:MULTISPECIES: peptide deformylase [Roseobacteraceae]|jgi:peptide deformylase|uniref:Peptide deformylase-like n=1 Tax=Pseudosulfitobacter pseudonitzschiae TaxID=1402135 RepID=A0A221K3A3_9RHOB|nr:MULTISPECIES: peptide deformylase [Roseobacteraceae]ASM73481.1 peptide deformylase 1 [Pseudosulfitobacter pseudonitzschiae]
MTVRPFVPWPDKRLRTATAPVETITDEIRALWADMVETMDAMPGVGLAAPQIGVMLQVAVVDATPDRSRRILLANPMILTASDEVEAGTEASPNLPGVHAEIIRPKNVTVRFLNPQGMIDRRDFEGLEARSVQHQIDHLAGRMYFDNLGRVKRDMLIRKARKSR